MERSKAQRLFYKQQAKSNVPAICLILMQIALRTRNSLHIPAEC